MLERAIRERWPMTAEFRRIAMQSAMKRSIDPKLKARDNNQAFLAVLKADTINVALSKDVSKIQVVGKDNGPVETQTTVKHDFGDFVKQYGDVFRRAATLASRPGIQGNDIREPLPPASPPTQS
jgi:hypothetical protein